MNKSKFYRNSFYLIASVAVLALGWAYDAYGDEIRWAGDNECLITPLAAECKGTQWSEFFDKPDYSDPCRTSENDEICRREHGISKQAQFRFERIKNRELGWSRADKTLGGLVVAERFHTKGITATAAVHSAAGLLLCEYFVPQGEDGSVVYKNETTTCLIAENLLLNSKKLVNNNLIGTGGFSDKEAHFIGMTLLHAGCTEYFSRNQCLLFDLIVMVGKESLDKQFDVDDIKAGAAGVAMVELVNLEF